MQASAWRSTISAPGYSSLAYLTRFPFDTIKIDKALVSDTSDKRAILLRSVITMARELDMQVVAEGIESEEDAIQLAQMGCDFGQSFLFGPPIGSDSDPAAAEGTVSADEAGIGISTSRRGGSLPHPAERERH